MSNPTPVSPATPQSPSHDTNKSGVGGTTYSGPLFELEALRTERDELLVARTGFLDRINTLEGALRLCEWGDTDIMPTGDVRHCCPECDRTEDRGHRAMCSVGAALAMAQPSPEKDAQSALREHKEVAGEKPKA